MEIEIGWRLLIALIILAAAIAGRRSAEKDSSPTLTSRVDRLDDLQRRRWTEKPQ